MKKFLIATVAMSAIASFGVVFGQANTDSHDVRVRIPNLLMLRIVADGSNAAVAAPVVTFDFDTNATGLGAYMAMVESGNEATLNPTGANFTDVVVLSNRAAWSVNVVATDFTFSDNVVGDAVAAGLALGDISVDITAVADANVITSINDSFFLSTSPQTIVLGAPTRGWASLGIGGNGYGIRVDGDEAPGTYATTVTYTITAP